MLTVQELLDGSVETLSMTDGAIVRVTRLDVHEGKYRVRHISWMQIDGDQRMPVASSETSFDNVHIARAELHHVHENPPSELAARVDDGE